MLVLNMSLRLPGWTTFDLEAHSSQVYISYGRTNIRMNINIGCMSLQWLQGFEWVITDTFEAFVCKSSIGWSRVIFCCSDISRPQSARSLRCLILFHFCRSNTLDALISMLSQLVDFISLPLFKPPSTIQSAHSSNWLILFHFCRSDTLDASIRMLFQSVDLISLPLSIYLWVLSLHAIFNQKLLIHQS